ncbi:MAG: M23 family metallopeptidase [Armatimonadetes bacterium]|nr:M23 family metallopeptidase [Armatimonadota bacterium]
MSRAVFTVLLTVSSLRAAPATSTRPAWPSLSRGEVLVSGLISAVDRQTGRVLVSTLAAQRWDGPSLTLDPPETATLLVPIAYPTFDLRRLTAGQGVALVTRPRSPRPWQVVSLTVAGPEDAPSRSFVATLVPDAVAFPYSDRTTRDWARVPMIFPVLGGAPWHDTFLKPIRGMAHLGQDLGGTRMTPLVAAFDGVVALRRARDAQRANTVILLGDNGWEALYTHLNNDTPGTADNRGRDTYAFAAGLREGQHVRAGQLLGWIGDSGMASGPHLHFELRRMSDGLTYNAAPSLWFARRLNASTAPPELRTDSRRPGETRLNGVIHDVDFSRRVLVVNLSTRTINGTYQVLSQPHRAYVRLGRLSGLALAGSGRVLPLDKLAVADPVALLGRLHGESLLLRAGWVEVPGLLAGRRVAEVL